MPFVSVPKDLSKVKTKVAFNLTRRQLICFSVAGFIGVPSYLFTRSHIGNEAAVLLMVGLMLPFFFLAMYERDGQTLEKIIRNILRARFLRPKVRPYQTQNLYAFFNEMEVHHAKQTAEKTGRRAAKAYSSKEETKNRTSCLQKKGRTVIRPSLHEQESSFPERKSRLPHNRPFPIRKSIRMESAGWRNTSSPRRWSFSISTINWHKMRTKR